MRKTNTKCHFSNNRELNTTEIYASFVFTMITLYITSNTSSGNSQKLKPHTKWRQVS